MPRFNPGEIWKIPSGAKPCFFGSWERGHEDDRHYFILNVKCTVRKKYTEYNINVVDLRNGKEEVLYIDSKTYRQFLFKVQDDENV